MDIFIKLEKNPCNIPVTALTMEGGIVRIIIFLTVVFELHP